MLCPPSREFLPDISIPVTSKEKLNVWIFAFCLFLSQCRSLPSETTRIQPTENTFHLNPYFHSFRRTWPSLWWLQNKWESCNGSGWFRWTTSGSVTLLLNSINSSRAGRRCFEAFWWSSVHIGGSSRRVRNAFCRRISCSGQTITASLSGRKSKSLYIRSSNLAYCRKLKRIAFLKIHWCRREKTREELTEI